ncbi:hypothetical protein AVEN_134709-1 [Araneus ventricosus]|uniref:Mos1 transposase HTH domain-containing protein n=1 Tax=Araneus ventricosus TaxID=182803 RepID=A0A4Y2KCB3_ARAVE|nr:hypothetical protein AVEN_134709-1 [Araneus ventricosus]
MEQRINLKFLYELGKSAVESRAMLKQVYGDDTMTLKTEYAWLKKFSGGRERSKAIIGLVGLPTTSRTGTNNERVRELLQRDRRLTIRMMSGELDIPRETGFEKTQSLFANCSSSLNRGT